MKSINAELLQKMFIAGAKNIEANKELINELNVFPVPDGDTGTNMTLTIMSAATEVGAIKNPDLRTLSKAISTGSLRGARGNSGVILSQLLRGFTKEIKEENEIDEEIFARACVKAVETAYKAVMKPKEGTILTVAKSICDKACSSIKQGYEMEDIFDAIIEEGEKSLEMTPELLPVLKQAGVVDSGGKGLMTILHGAYDAMMGKEIDYTMAEASPRVNVDASSMELDTSDIKFGYCTEFIVNLDHELPEKELMSFRDFLSSLGDSLVFVPDEEIIKVHVHTNDPGKAFSKAITYGSLSRMKIDNMREEHQERLFKNAAKLAAQQESELKLKEQEPASDYGFVAVAAGDGLEEIFKGLGVDYVISGGQTMNPSTDDILKGVDKVNARTVFVLPNNGNIIMAANQAEKLSKDKNVVVIPTKTIPQGIGAMIGFMADASTEENKESMAENMQYVKSGEITYAVRDTEIDNKKIKEGDFMGIADGSLLAVGHDLEDTAVDMIKEMTDEDSEIISIYYGADVSEENADALSARISEAFPDLEVEVCSGGQSVYYYFVSVE